MIDTRWHMKSNKSKALMLAKRQLSELVCDAVNLEGLPFTLPEIQTLLDGVTVGGHKITDQHIALNQAETWRTLFKLIETDQFAITVETVYDLHRIAAKDDALEWGRFRTGSVTIAGTDYMPPEAHLLPALFAQMKADASCLTDIYDQAIHFQLEKQRSPQYIWLRCKAGRNDSGHKVMSHYYGS